MKKLEWVISRILYPHAGHDHFSWMPVTRHLLRSTRKHRTDSPQTFPYLILLRVGFALPFMSP
jgi:hypothetical protein